MKTKIKKNKKKLHLYIHKFDQIEWKNHRLGYQIERVIARGRLGRVVVVERDVTAGGEGESEEREEKDCEA